MANFKHGDKVYYVDFKGTKTYRTVENVEDKQVFFTNGNWMPAIELHLVEEAVAVPNDNVNNPAHYTQGGIETLDFIKAKLTTEAYKGFLQANIIKYVTRFEHKNGEEDLRKAEFYLRELIDVVARGE
jgi:hypothetical protein